uniref:beta strand repeat-containing protein n=1 Tax=Pusillimonas sp. TaxID=3040095 RepID=UPI0037C71289
MTTTWKQKKAILRVTTLAAALMGVYGGAGAQTVITNPYVCSSGQCSLDDAQYSVTDNDNKNTWAVQAKNAGTELTIDGGSIEALGRKNRAVGATHGAQVFLNDVEVNTETSDSNYWGNHGVQAHGKDSSVEINGAHISTTGKYSNGIQAQDRGQVHGSDVTITANGGSSYTFGVEAGSGGGVALTDSTISVSGAGAAGARAYTGAPTSDGKQVQGLVSLERTNVSVGTGAIGLMAGDTDDGVDGSAGTIQFADGKVVSEDGPAALVRFGSLLYVENSELESSGHTVDVEGVGSKASFRGARIKTDGVGTGNKGLIAAVHADDHASVSIFDSSVEASGAQYTRGLLATNAGHIQTERVAVSTTGDNSHAVQAHGAVPTGTVPIFSRIHLEGGSVHTEGRESYGLYAQQFGSVTAKDVAITTDGEAGFGAFAYNNGDLQITGGSITTNGEISFEHPTLDVDVGNYGVLVKNKSTAIIDGTTITTRGADAQGLRAENDGAEGHIQDTSSSINATNVTVITSGEDAHGVTAYGSAAKDGEWIPGSTVSFNGGSISTSGDGAVGALAQSGALVMLNDTQITTTGTQGHGVGASSNTFSNPTINAYGPSLAVLNKVHIRTSGDGAFGVAAFNGDSQIQLTESSITTSGEGGAGVFLGNGADVTLDRVTVETKGPSILSYFGPNEDVEQIAGDLEQSIEVKDSVLETNNGVLMRIDRKAGAEDGEVFLDLLGATTAVGNIENYGADGKLDSRANREKYTHVKLDDTASWIGVMVDASTTVAKSGDTVSGNLDGDVTAGDNSTVSFQNVPQINGSVSVTPGSQFTFGGNTATSISGNFFGMPGSGATFNNGANIAGSVQGAGSSFTFNGDANISGPVQGSGSQFQFSTSGGSTNLGSLDLGEGSSIGGGTSDNPINVQGDANIAGGSTLGGNVNINGHLSLANSFLSPGNSIGGVWVDTIAPLAGNTFQVEVDGNGQADLLVVRSGNVELDGAKLQVDQYGGYRLDHDYTIIRTEAGTVVGQFASQELGDTFAGTLVQLDPTKYGEKDVKISLSANQDAIDRAGYSSNQNATLDGVLSVIGQNASADAVMFMQPEARK